MGANHIEIGGQKFEKYVSGKLLDRKNVDEQGATLESLEREGAEDPFDGDYRGTEQNDFWVFFAKVVGVGKEGNAQGLGGVGVVRAGVGEYGVALADECSCQELPEVSEANDGNLEMLAGVEMSSGELGFIVKRLSSVEGSYVEFSTTARREDGSLVVESDRVAQRAERERSFGPY